MFDCVLLAKVLGDFDYVPLPNPIEVNPTIGVRLSSITERLIDYAGVDTRLIRTPELNGQFVPGRKRQIFSLKLTCFIRTMDTILCLESQTEMIGK